MSRQLLKKVSGGVFCNPYEYTPEDVFGGVVGKHCVTASNIAKYDYLYAVIVFKDQHLYKSPYPSHFDNFSRYNRIYRSKYFPNNLIKLLPILTVHDLMDSTVHLNQISVKGLFNGRVKSVAWE